MAEQHLRVFPAEQADPVANVLAAVVVVLACCDVVDAEVVSVAELIASVPAESDPALVESD